MTLGYPGAGLTWTPLQARSLRYAKTLAFRAAPMLGVVRVDPPLDDWATSPLGELWSARAFTETADGSLVLLRKRDGSYAVAFKANPSS
ncbi:conserved protein of unknown function (plasmid) [Rhodovastum atsumiense]|uniref:Uncharacterized protein n=1 Tax=Rhodovastum atsumiense TaxID=504468 RepID=A0A5M6IUH3_9PROT|nr:hypothetical protein [Rhodovastum atsumiense]KAA5611599.1 hypothetical protein F1189_13630 [Rhodovastum atsumiense]CAH2606317.1 conserved protein of unknown function [Rhodovastum atsumiense]